MPRTPLRNDAVLVSCDAESCERSIVVAKSSDQLPAPWRMFHVDTWIGDFVACSDACETRLRSNPIRK